MILFFSLTNEEEITNYLHWVWVTENFLLCTAVRRKGCYLVSIKIKTEEPLEIETKVIQDLENNRVLAMCAITTDEIAIQFMDGSCSSFKIESNTLHPWFVDGNNDSLTNGKLRLKFPNPAPTMDFCIIKNKV